MAQITTSTNNPNVAVPVSTVAPVAPALAALCWGSIFAGSFAALGIHLLLTLLFAGIGVQAVNPMTDSNLGSKFSTGAGIAWSVSALIALWIGGWIAGRSAQSRTTGLGGLHGFLVWSLATVVTFLLFSTTAGLALTGAAKVAGSGISAVGKAAGAGGSAASGAVDQFAQKNSDMISSFIDEALPSGPGANPANLARARREIGWALYHAFSQGDVHSPETRTAVSRAVAESTGRNQQDADRLVDSWISSYDRMTQDLQAASAKAEQKAREAADKAADVATKAAIWTFVAFVIGALSSVWGGRSGANAAWNVTQDELAVSKK